MIFPRSIYAIQHNITKRIYIGSSANPETRYLNHLYRLRAGHHDVEEMQRDYNEYGEDYSLFILEEIKKWEERVKEYEWMRKYNSTDKEFGYNYKDREKLISQRQIPIVSGKPIGKYSPGLEGARKFYISEIVRLINQCSDIDLFDLIIRILEKKVNVTQAETR